jgi:DNA-directed RNA polymerase subunit RPC12/RpoP
MTNLYQPPYYQPPTTEVRSAEGELIYFGPYNKDQAPFMECASCGQPITVGQRLTMLQEFVLGVTQSGRLQCVPVRDFPEPAYVHSDCSAEFSHDQITKEPCGASDDAEQVCMYCDQKLNGESDE